MWRKKIFYVTFCKSLALNEEEPCYNALGRVKIILQQKMNSLKFQNFTDHMGARNNATSSNPVQY